MRSQDILGLDTDQVASRGLQSYKAAILLETKNQRVKVRSILCPAGLTILLLATPACGQSIEKMRLGDWRQMGWTNKYAAIEPVAEREALEMTLLKNCIDLYSSDPRNENFTVGDAIELCEDWVRENM